MTIFPFFIQDFEKWFLLLFSQHQYHRITLFCLGEIGNIKNSQNTKAELSTCNSSAPTASIYHPTLCNFWWTPWLSGQKTESSSCKEKVITSIHPRAICSNSAVNQRSTPASELICIYHGCLLDRFSQAEKMCLMIASWRWHIFCRQHLHYVLTVCRASGRHQMKRKTYFFFLSTYSNKKDKSTGKHSRWGSLDVTSPFLLAPFLPSPFCFPHSTPLPSVPCFFIPVLLLLCKKYI